MPITLNSKVYNWAQFDQSGTSRYLETSNAMPTGYSPLTARVTMSTGKSQKVKWRLAIPTVATADSPCGCVGAVLGTSYVTIEVDVPSTGTLTDRTDLLARVVSLVSTTEFGDSVKKLIQPAG